MLYYGKHRRDYAKIWRKAGNQRLL